MPIDRDTLDAIARRYSATMTSIRGRRVHRLVMRELSRFDHVLPATADDGTPALLALGTDGSAAVCRTDGRGSAAPVVTWARLGGASVTTSYDLLKDSLPVVSWTVSHPDFARLGGGLTISAADLSAVDRGSVEAALRNVGA